MRFLCVLLLAAAPAWAQSFRVVTVVEGLEHPWSLAFLPDGRMLVTERPGRLRIIEGGKLLAAPVEGLPAIAQHGQGGLFDVVLHPEYKNNQLVYISYAGRGEDGIGTELIRAKFI
jgi:glucose/arabinose dehydrogenase